MIHVIFIITLHLRLSSSNNVEDWDSYGSVVGHIYRSEALRTYDNECALVDLPHRMEALRICTRTRNLAF
ncbi:hypothetical protein Y032_0227g2808 [Ancylostoma ceylanicum]|uniref:Secreted protein n=1 Tax=Ancylostoma ceylanicum TaxID=53326 RepID=A0A016SHE7_9BILA|nr:hypothetical protein Y032_0227g2808 [Ancylostoma ceylanicum]